MRDSSEINSFCILFIDSSVSPSNLSTSFGVVLDALRRPHPSLKFTLNPSIKILSPWPGMMKNVINGKKEWKKYWDKKNNFRLFDLASVQKKNIFIHNYNFI